MDLSVPTRGGLPQLWAGIECTVNRIGNRYDSQLARNGHDRRDDDLQRIAALRVRAIRYPVLWERTAPSGVEHADWRWPDRRLAGLRELGIEPIVGLVHHGSGPPDTHLADPGFAPGLARYAAAVARRYPWVELYTPVNEPLTTARFSGLYGLWYPHGNDPRCFKDTLLNQCRATVLAMREIRSVNPRARLVATDDLGKTFSTPALAYQATFNNEFRWLGWDLLCGRVDHRHPLWPWLTDVCGASARELGWFCDNRCPPDIVGANHYITSERFLDERLDRYPGCYHGGNGRQRYADIEAARCLQRPTHGLGALLREAWERYRTPIAITEVHIDATRDDQLRWLAEVWQAACDARAEGIDLTAVTVWALFGSFDWNSVLTRAVGYYEPGAFDVRGGEPRPTAIAALMRTLGGGEPPSHPVLATPGWWHRPGRHFCEPVPATDTDVPQAPCGRHGGSGTRSADPADARPVLITGATGTLGRAFARICEMRGLAHVRVGRNELDIADPDTIERALERHAPWAVVNAAGYVRVDDAERDAERCFRENTRGAASLAAACGRHALPLVTFSTDLVFDGRKDAPYVESDTVAPLSVYGRSKAGAEALVLDRHPDALVVRTSAFFGPWDPFNYITIALRALAAGERFAAATDMVVSPTYVPDLVHACLDLLVDGETGLWHLSNGDALSWAELARQAASAASVDPATLHACRGRDLGFVAERPAYSALGTSRATGLLPPLAAALRRYVASGGGAFAHSGGAAGAAVAGRA